MIDYAVAAALRAITTITDFAALKLAEELRAFGDVNVFFFHNVNALTGAAE